MWGILTHTGRAPDHGNGGVAHGNGGVTHG